MNLYFPGMILKRQIHLRITLRKKTVSWYEQFYYVRPHFDTKLITVYILEGGALGGAETPSPHAGIFCSYLKKYKGNQHLKIVD